MLIKKVWNHIWPQMKKYKWSYYSIYIINALRVILLTLLTPIILKKIIDLISNPSLNHITDKTELFHLVFIFSLLLLGGLITGRLSGYVTTYFQSNVIRELHNHAFEKLTNHSYKFFTNQFSGSLVAKAKRLVRGFEIMHDIFVWEFFMTTFSLLGIFYVLLKEARFISYIFIGWSIVYFFISLLFIKYKIKYDLLESEADSKVSGGISDALSNILNVKIFSARSDEIARYKKITQDEHLSRSKAWLIGNFADTVQSVMMAGIHIVLLYSLANGWIAGEISTGVFVLVETYTLNIFDKLWNLSKAMTRFVKAFTDVKEITDIMDQKIDILDSKNPEKLKIKDGKINFENVCFQYVEDNEVFSDFNLEIKAGEKIGLVGHSGSGKSTITKLLLRFADIQEGSIKIDNQNISKITQDDLRSKISYVPQESILFHRSIKENIGYSKPGSTDEEIIEAAKKAHAHEFISGLQKGYDTLVGERGIKLSGGERQRVTIARAMLKSAPILILDEATSSLDSISESYIQEAFNELMKGKTTIVIAHRLSTIQKMDRIIVLENGKIIEEGTHRQLIRKKGQYAELWNHQVGGFIE